MTTPHQSFLEKILNQLFPHKTIVNCEHKPYLLRWYVIRTKHIALFIHKFVMSDEDRALHDHPWNFMVIPLWRGYFEHVGGSRQKHGLSWYHLRRVWPIIGMRYRRAEFRHRIELVDGKPAWSLFFRFHERRTWGFWPTGGFISWSQWWKEKCE